MKDVLLAVLAAFLGLAMLVFMAALSLMPLAIVAAAAVLIARACGVAS